ncbi:MAG: Lrp/AsnC ligand binding domain-containing protein [Candidatus Bathyarchaeota archaeon]|nr:Lrp/AsnC ligand binding domain-containing protein [Candidatus Bathyarchaeota archaeon]
MTLAYVLINTELGEEGNVIKELRSIESVKEAHLTYGVYDVIAIAEAKNREKLKEIVAFKIRRLKDIRSTLTMIAIER